jgi:hypothetical protein
MSAYRYVVFPHGKQPTVDEVRQLQGFAGALANHFAWGTRRHDDRLAIAFEDRGYEHLLRIDAGFESLIRKWEARGCELVDHLAFAKDPTALRPTSTLSWQAHDGRGSVQTLRNQEQLAAQELVAKEAIARSLLGVERTLEHYAVVQRIAAAFPYALILAGTIVVVGAGLYIRDRMLDSDRERRHDTITRVVDDPLRESLTGQADRADAAAVTARDPGAAAASLQE